MVYQSSTALFFSLVGDRVGEIGLFNSLLLRSNPPAPLVSSSPLPLFTPFLPLSPLFSLSLSSFSFLVSQVIIIHIVRFPQKKHIRLSGPGLQSKLLTTPYSLHCCSRNTSKQFGRTPCLLA